MPEFKTRTIDGTDIVKELQSDVYFFTLEAYARLAGCPIAEIEQKAREAVIDNPGDQVPSNYQVLDLGIVGAKEVKGRYLLPAQLAFYWLMSDCKTKALMIGGEALDATVREQYNDVRNPIESGKRVRLKKGIKPVAAIEFHKNHVHFKQGEFGIVFKNPTPQIYAGYPDDDVMLLVKKPGNQNPYKVRVNIKDIELVED